MLMDSILTQFTKYMRFRRYDPDSIPLYLRSVKRFLELFLQSGSHLKTMNHYDIIDFIIDCEKDDLTLHQLSTIFNHLHTFGKFLIYEKLVPWQHNVFKDFIFNLREHRAKPKTLPTTEQMAYLDKLFATAIIKHRLLFEAIHHLLMQTGARYHEIAKLTEADVDFGAQSIIVPKTKQHQIERYELPDETWSVFMKYYRSMDLQMDLFEYLTIPNPYYQPLSLFRLPGKAKHVSIVTFSNILKSFGREAGIKNMHPHLYRAIRCTAVAKEFGLDAAMHAIRVSSNKTALRYIVLSDDEIDALFAGCTYYQEEWFSLSCL